VNVEGQDERIGESIREHGVIHPVEVGPDYVSEGHHRIAISEGIDPTREIPVVHIR
jgi:ParB-like chromosome segregation protein Spo0J